MDLTPTNLTVEEMSAKDNRVIIKSGGKSYSFFKMKKDGTESKAWQDYQNLNVNIGQMFCFGIKETEGEYQGKKVTYRNIMNIKLADPTANNATHTQPVDTYNAKEEIEKTKAFILKLVKLNNLKTKEGGWSQQSVQQSIPVTNRPN